MIVTGLIVGVALGFVFQRGRFCVTGAFRDLTLTRNTRWFSALIVLIAVHAVGIAAFTQLGLITPEHQAFPWLASIVGGLIFGFSIVLAGGCATGTYYRAGEGLVGSWFALLFYALFSAIMKAGPGEGLTTWIRDVTLPDGTLSETTGLSPWVFALALAVVAGLLVWHHQRTLSTPLAKLPPRRTGLAHILLEKRWNPFVTGAVIGVIATIAWPLSAATGRNSGLGITTPSSNITQFLATGDASHIDWGVLLVLGILVGSAVAAVLSGEFRVRVPDRATVLKSIVGGIGMGIGAAIAGGCTVGNSMVDTAQFSYQGWVSTFFMIVGAGLAAKATIRRRTPASAASGSAASGSATARESARV